MLPCPFCGSPAEHYPDGDMEGYIIMCGNKNGDCNLQAFGFATPEEAEKAWNTRAALLQGSQPVSNHDELQVIGWLRSDYNSDDKRDPNAPLFMLGSNDPSEAWGVKYIPLSGNTPAIPDDWVMVPKEPTQAMIKAWLSEVANFRGHAAGYKASLAAAPQREVK
ncbi:hypothetical protein CCG78_22805 [Salmonella enterica subsp. enterica serovar Newport]|nr:hypothetical protein [Salmonella enterica subsp. enterica serovar Newport]